MSAYDAVVQIRGEDVTWREIDGVVVVLDLSSSTYLTTNRAGAVLWHALIVGATVAQLIDLLRSSFAISGELASADVRTFLQLLEKNDLLRSPI